MKTLLLFEERTGKKVFCRFRTEGAVLYISIYLRKGNCKSEQYFVPKNGYGIKWNDTKGKKCKISRQYDSSKGESIVEFMVHPVVWVGTDFKHHGYPVEEIAQKCLSRINFYWYEK